MKRVLDLDWSHWLYGLFGAVIGGGSGAVVGSLAAMGITPEKYDLSANLSNTLKMFAACFILNAIISGFLWLKQKPLPDIVEEKPTIIEEPAKTTVIESKIAKT